MITANDRNNTYETMSWTNRRAYFAAIILTDTQEYSPDTWSLIRSVMPDLERDVAAIVFG